MSKDNTPLEECPDVVEMVCEFLGRRYKKSQIKDELRKIISNLSHQACEKVITAAKKQIRENFKLDPQEYRGYLVEELERLLRNDKTPTKYRLKTIHELVLLLGLDRITDTEAPEEYAKRVQEAMRAADNSVAGIPQQEDKDGLRKPQKISTQAGPPQQKETQADAKEVI